MRVIVFGATGRTGRAVVELAQARGDEVVAASRSVAQAQWPDGARTDAVDVLDAPAVLRACRGVDAAVLAVGAGTSREPTSVYSDGVVNVLAGLTATGASRLSVVSALPAGPREQLPVAQRIVARILDRFFGATYDDMRRMEAVLATSELDWSCVRPPRLVARPPRGTYRIGPHPLGGSIAHRDLAAAPLDVLDDPARQRTCSYVSW